MSNKARKLNIRHTYFKQRLNKAHIRPKRRINKVHGLHHAGTRVTAIDAALAHVTQLRNAWRRGEPRLSTPLWGGGGGRSQGGVAWGSPRAAWPPHGKRRWGSMRSLGDSHVACTSRPKANPLLIACRCVAVRRGTACCTYRTCSGSGSRPSCGCTAGDLGLAKASRSCRPCVRLSSRGQVERYSINFFLSGRNRGTLDVIQ